MNFYEQIFSRGRATGEGMTHFERLFAAKFGGSPPPEVREYTGAVPVTITADGTPLLDYIISGNTTQSGTPTPDNPIMPQGTGERTGNLWNEDYTGISGTITYKPVYVGEGAFTMSSDVEISAGSAGTLFLLAGNASSGASTATNGVYKNHDVTTTAIDGYVTVAYRYYTVDTPVGKHSMLNTGSTALPYEPYGYKIPILSADTTTNNYLGEVQTTRKIKKLVLTGEETWYAYSAGNVHQFYTQNMVIGGVASSSAYSTIAPYGMTVDSRIGDYGCYLVSSGNEIAFQMYGSKADFPTQTEWKAYLAQQYAAGTPVTIWYVLAESETGIVNEPLMRIGDYADTLSYAQAGVEIPTNNGSTTVDVDTTVKPSEIYIKYMG